MNGPKAISIIATLEKPTWVILMSLLTLCLILVMSAVAVAAAAVVVVGSALHPWCES